MDPEDSSRDAPDEQDAYLVDPWPDEERTKTHRRRRVSRMDTFAEYREGLRELHDPLGTDEVGPTLPPNLGPAPPVATDPTLPAELGSTSRGGVKRSVTADADLEERGTGVYEYRDPQSAAAEGSSDARIVANRYRMEAELAVGGMARIYRVRHLHLDRDFAMKILSPEMSSQPVFRKNFVREARVASQMEHPNIVAVTDFGVDDTYGAFLVMEYLKGETLRHRIQRHGPLRLHVALEVGLQLAEALHYIHQRNIIHCDIKAENIFLVDAPRQQRRRPLAKLLDFGLSKTRAMGAQLARSEVGGTPHYMSPEHFAGVAPQPSMDIYSMGVLLYEMLVGSPPFFGELEQLAVAHLRETPVAPSARVAGPLDERVDELICKALAKSPEDRQASMGQLVYELRTLLDMLGYGQPRRIQKRPERAPEPALDEGCSVFENSPCPQFRVDAELRIIVGNGALGSFLGRAPERLVGVPLDETKLRHVYPGLRADFLRCASEKTDLQQRIPIPRPDREDAMLLLWLVQEVDPASDAITFSGLIVPQT